MLCLKFLNLSHFNTSKVSNLFGMFNKCTSLIYLNLFSFKLNKMSQLSLCKHNANRFQFMITKV